MQANRALERSCRDADSLELFKKTVHGTIRLQ